jgi:hypothetical protein
MPRSFCKLRTVKSIALGIVFFPWVAYDTYKLAQWLRKLPYQQGARRA